MNKEQKITCTNIWKLFGPDEKRIIRAYYDVRILKNDMTGRSDSLHLDKLAGVTKLLSKPLTRKQEQIFSEVDRNKSNPVIWFNKSQMSGNNILLMSNKKTNKLDSLKINGNVLIIEKDTLSKDGYNQIKGGLLDGSFRNGKLDNIIIKIQIPSFSFVEVVFFDIFIIYI